MIVLGIETSCDETALSIIDTRGTIKDGYAIRVLANQTLSQIKLHKQYGGVFPNLAKREHGRNLIPLLRTVLEKAARVDGRFKIKDLSKKDSADLLKTYNLKLKSVLEREPELLEQFLEFIPLIEKPLTCPVRNREGSQRDSVSNGIDAIAVTYGPGLEPCLWAGINFAKALSLVWDIPVVPVNHMEGHIVSALLRRKECNTRHISQNSKDDSAPLLHATCYLLHVPAFPAVALLISGGHTELVLVKNWFQYEMIGQTRDDAVGEAFDKVARLLGLPYPGGPEISTLAEIARMNTDKETDRHESGIRVNSSSHPSVSVVLPRPMLHSDDFDFSFSGLKTAVLYLLKKIEQEAQRGYQRSSAFSIRDNPRLQSEIAREFEDAVTDVLIAKTKKAIEHYGARALLIGGGVIANKHIRSEFEKLSRETGVTLHIPEPNLTTDNALMIAVAGFLRLSLKNGSTKAQKGELTAKGNLALDEK